MEIWDVYDKDLKKAGFDIARGEKTPTGYYHLACDVVVRHSDGTYLVMQRDYEKDVYPGFYEVSAGGSALKGEDKYDCVKRELKEETGIVAEEFTEIGFELNDDRQYICYDFLCVVDCDKDSIVFQKGETVSYKWQNKDELIELKKTGKIVPSFTGRMSKYFEVLNVGKKFKVTVDRKLGSRHPKHKEIIYPINYGYIEGLIGKDGEFQDAYILDADVPLDEYEGLLIGVIIRLDDEETKWIIANRRDYTDQEINEAIEFQEKFFHSVLVR